MDGGEGVRVVGGGAVYVLWVTLDSLPVSHTHTHTHISRICQCCLKIHWCLRRHVPKRFSIALSLELLTD